jgi:hypothetical protein
MEDVLEVYVAGSGKDGKKREMLHPGLLKFTIRIQYVKKFHPFFKMK